MQDFTITLRPMESLNQNKQNKTPVFKFNEENQQMSQTVLNLDHTHKTKTKL